SHLVADSVEHAVWHGAFGNEGRDSAERRLLICELAGARLGRGKVSAAFGVRDRGCQQLGEAREPVLRVGRPGKCVSRHDDHDAPEAPLYRHGRTDRRAIAELACLRYPGTGRLVVIFDASGATGAEYRRRQALWIDRGLGREWKLSCGAV